MISSDEIAQMIRAGIEGADVTVLGDDGAHFEAVVVSDQFQGKLPLARHRLVYAALGDGMQSRIHALSIKALTPAELASQESA